MVVKVRSAEDVTAEADVLRRMAKHSKSHTVVVESVIPNFRGGRDSALVTQFVPKDPFWRTDEEARRFVMDLLEVSASPCCAATQGR